MWVLASLLIGHLADGLGQAPFVVDGALIGGGTGAGVVLRADDAWQRACEEASGGAPVGYFRSPTGVILAATANGMIRTDDDGCTWAPVDGVLRNLEVTAIRGALLAPDIVYLTTGTPGAPNALWRSDDGGLTFTETALAGVIHPLYDVATSADGQTVVVTGWDLDDELPLVRVSHDGGQQFVGVTDPDFNLAAYERARVLAVDSSIWLSLLGGGTASLAVADTLLTDVQVVETFPGEVLSLVSLGAARVLLARPDAVYRQPMDGAAFALVPDVRLGCLERGDTATRAWGCGVPGSGVQFALTDDGVSFATALATADIVDRPCPEGTPGAAICPLLDAGVADAGAEDAGPQDDAGGAQPADAGPRPDAGEGEGEGENEPPPADTRDDDDEGCTTSAGAWAPLTLLVLAHGARRRRAGLR